MQPNRDVESGETADDDLDNITLPTYMKVIGADGNVTRKALGLASKTVVCCGLPKPPGGWYGPFGFLRILSYIFILVAIVSVFFVVLAVYQGDWLGVISSITLSIVSGVCALAAYAHEGLANEVTAMARQNERYAEKNDRLADQVKELGKVEDRMNTLKTSMGISVDDLKNKLRVLHKLTATSQLTAILRAFTSADSECGNRDRSLQDEEITDFFDTAKPIFTQAAPDFDFNKLISEVKEHNQSMGLPMMHLLVNAVIAGSEDKVGKCTAMLDLVMFALDPVEFLETTLDSTFACLKACGYTRPGLQKVFTARAGKHDGDSIPCAELLDISKEIMIGDKGRKGRALILQ